MMIFSASHSARFAEHQNSNVEDSRRAWRQHWVQQGVSAHGQIWSANFGQRLSEEHEHAAAFAQRYEQMAEDVVGESEDEGLGASVQGSTNSHGYSSDGDETTPGRTDSHSFPPPPSPPSSSRMASKTPLWISLWFLITVPVIFWDAGYCFMRPRSMRGGDLHWLWTPYSLYQDIDYVYGLRAYENNEGFTNAQSFMNIVENLLNIAYLYLTHVTGSPIAPLIGFASIVMTLSKTVLYWLNEHYCGWCSVGHNDWYTLIVYWIIPNGLWLIFPTIILYKFGSDIAGTLRQADKLEKKKASGKRQ